MLILVLKKWIRLILKEPLTVQQIFDLMIETKLYSENQTIYMCHALFEGVRKDIISLQEEVKAKTAINLYLSENPNSQTSVLEAKLKLENRPSSFNDRLAIYKDWKHRPR